jgi:hypothetical protein
MEPESSLPHSQEPDTYTYPEADQFRPCSHPTSWSSSLILSSNLRLVLPSGLLPSVLPTKFLYAPLPSPIRNTNSHSSENVQLFCSRLALAGVHTRRNQTADFATEFVNFVALFAIKKYKYQKIVLHTQYPYICIFLPNIGTSRSHNLEYSRTLSHSHHNFKSYSPLY